MIMLEEMQGQYTNLFKNRLVLVILNLFCLCSRFTKFAAILGFLFPFLLQFDARAYSGKPISSSYPRLRSFEPYKMLVAICEKQNLPSMYIGNDFDFDFVNFAQFMSSFGTELKPRYSWQMTNSQLLLVKNKVSSTVNHSVFCFINEHFLGLFSVKFSPDRISFPFSVLTLFPGLMRMTDLLSRL